MNGEYYIKTPQGEYIKERRSFTTMDLILTKIETMENNIEVKLEAVKDKMGLLEDKINTTLSVHQKAIEDLDAKLSKHCDDAEEIDNALSEHDKKLNTAETYIERIKRLESKYKILEERVERLEQAPIKKDAALVKDLKKYIRNGFIALLGSGIIAFLGYLVISYIRTL